MDLFDVVAGRHSYRGEFLPDPVPRADLEKIVAAGAAAPSGCNREFTSFVIVDEPDLRGQVAALLDKPYMRTAPAFVVVVTDATPAYAERSFELQDAGAAMENMLLAVTALGYAGVWLEGYLLHDGVGQRLGKLLSVPATLTARMLLPVGRPAGPVAGPPKKPLSERLHINGWRGPKSTVDS